MSRTVIDPDILAALLDSRDGWTYSSLATALTELHEDADTITAGQVRRAVYELRVIGLTNFGSEDARLREDSLTMQLMRNSGRGFGEYKQHTLVQYLRQLDRLRQGLPHSWPERRLSVFEAELLTAGEVIDLRPSGEPYRRPARPHEAGHIVVQPLPDGGGSD